METKRLILNETSYFGQGAIQQITTEISRRGYKKALVVTDKDLVKFNVAGKVLAVLENGNVPYVVFDEVKANPTVNM
jgi:lactaldehyde reductase